MPQEVNYATTVCDLVIQYIKATDAYNPFNSYFYGDPGAIPIDQMPAIIVDLLDTKISQGPTQTDEIKQTIMIGLVINKKTFMDDFDDTTVSWKKKLELLVEGRTPAGVYDPTSIMGILRQNFTLGNFIYENDADINYGEVPRNGVEGEDDWTGEAHIKFSVSHYQERLGST